MANPALERLKAEGKGTRGPEVLSCFLFWTESAWPLMFWQVSAPYYGTIRNVRCRLCSSMWGCIIWSAPSVSCRLTGDKALESGHLRQQHTTERVCSKSLFKDNNNESKSNVRSGVGWCANSIILMTYFPLDLRKKYFVDPLFWTITVKLVKFVSAEKF